tara:strand:- start:664 stop:876 length:213 start_codon:yes stop_codon:yes gene_type:complete
MTYIWNRADRVDEEVMPNRVLESFQKWKSERLKELDRMTDAEKVIHLRRINKQEQQMTENLESLGYHQYV